MYAVCFVFLIIISQVFVIHINNTYVMPLRKKMKKQDIAQSRHFIRLLMSKQEIMQSNKNNEEIEKFTKHLTKKLSIDHIIQNYIRPMFNIPVIIAHCIIVITVFYSYQSIRNGTFSYGIFAALSAMSGYMVQLMLTSTGTFKDVAKKLFSYTNTSRDLFYYPPNRKLYYRQKVYL